VTEHIIENNLKEGSSLKLSYDSVDDATKITSTTSKVKKTRKSNK